MSDSNWAALRQQFLAGYADLSRQLAKRFGSAELAEDALQETFLRIERGGHLKAVDNPKAYIRRMAVNIGRNMRRRDQRLLSQDEADLFFQEAADEAPDAYRALAGRQAIDAVRAALQAMPARRRDIFLSTWVDNTPQPEIARRLGMSLRRVQKESQAARETVRLALRENLAFDDSPPGRILARRVSSQ